MKVPKAAVAAASLAMILLCNSIETIISPPPIPINPVLNPAKQPPR